MSRGILTVLSGPSGVGKGAVCAALRSRSTQLVYSISATTRAPRQGEIEAVNYFFKTKEQFEAMIANDELLEWAEYVGNYYGTPRSFVDHTLDAGQDIILEIEVQGAMKIKKKLPQSILIFLMPPSLGELQNRIESRGTESSENIRRRMSAAVDELQYMEHYDYAVVNDQIESACSRIESILVAEHCRWERFSREIKKWMEEVY